MLLYLLAPRAPKYFLPETCAFLALGDGNAHSKKDATVRRGELRDAVLPAVLACIVRDPRSVVTQGDESHVVWEALSQAPAADKATTGALTAICGLATVAPDSIIADSVAHRLLRRLLQHTPGQSSTTEGRRPVLPFLASFPTSSNPWTHARTHTRTHTHTHIYIYIYIYTRAQIA